MTGIGDDAFGLCRNLTCVTIGNSVTKIGEEIMKNAVVSKITSTETIDAELSLNNSISNIILISVCAIGTVWSALCFVSLFTADIRRKKFTIDTL